MQNTSNYKHYRYHKGESAELDAQYKEAAVYGKIRLARDGLFWRHGLGQYYVPLQGISRIFRRIQEVRGKLCCGAQNFNIEYLVLILPEGEELVLHIGDDVKNRAEALLEHLKQAHPEIAYGKV